MKKLPCEYRVVKRELRNPHFKHFDSWYVPKDMSLVAKQTWRINMSPTYMSCSLAGDDGLLTRHIYIPIIADVSL